MRGGEGREARGNMGRPKEVPRVWPGKRHAASTTRKNEQISTWIWCVSTEQISNWNVVVGGARRSSFPNSRHRGGKKPCSQGA
jgi:hypothetical protein